MMNNINNVSSVLFAEFAKMGKFVAVHAEDNILIVKVGNADTRIMNWESMSNQQILDIAKGLVIKENYKGSILLHG
jgi:hypothetical protein